MSTSRRSGRQTVTALRARKGGEKIVALTAYTAPVARLLDPWVDILLVGDSLGMVVYGMDTTLAVTVDMMVMHGRAVTRASSRACVVVDLPFGSYQASEAQAFATSARVMAETGCDAVKLEGGVEMAPTLRYLIERGIPVMGHVGLMPQRVKATGGYRTQGRTAPEAQSILDDALAVVEAGAFALVIEAVTEPLAREVTARIPVPVIGIGASAACDGQVLVTEDVVGLSEQAPRFAKQYTDIGAFLMEAARCYALDVREGRFPAKEHIIQAAPPE